jgi:dihydrofolate synthase/folylpolyglutamate synthase
VIHRHPLIVLDVAHNQDGIKQVLEQVELNDPHHLHVVLGVVRDKDTEKILALFPKSAIYYFTNADIPRALPAEELQKQAALFFLKGNIYPNVNTAIKAAADKALKDDMILVCGSVFLVGEVSGF